MHLKSLELHGFKSFAERTALSFPGRTDGRYGITAVVGPNGSGKSNIVDAIRWVMGEQSMKTLRGKKGADVIFSGSAGKGRMGVATVVMTLDNQDGRMPVPYEEVAVSRRIDQSGESEYLVNGAPVRLFDLQVLLAQAQFGHGSYGTIGQGMIEQLIVHTPKERKEFFDEACGIKEFQIKRHQASLKLERCAAHMHEADLLLAEITPRLKTLSRQMKKLEERQEVERKLRELRESYYATLWYDANGQLEALRRVRAEIAEDVEDRQRAILAMQEEIALIAAPGSRLAFTDFQREYERLMEEKQRVHGELVLIDTKLNMEPRREGEDTGWMMAKLEQLRADVARVNASREAASREAERAGQQVKKLESAASAARERREELYRLIGTAEAEGREFRENDVVPTPELRAAEVVLKEKDHFGLVHGIVAQLARPVDDRFTLALDVAAGQHLSSVVTEDDRAAERWVDYLRQAKIGVATFLPRTGVKPRVPPQDIARLLSLPGVHGLATELVRFEKKFETVFSFVFGSTLIVESFAEARAVGIGRIRMVTMSGDVFETSGTIKGGYRRRLRGGASFGDGLLAREHSAALAEKERHIAAWTAEREALEAAREPMDMALRAGFREEEQVLARMTLLVDQEQKAAREAQSLADDVALGAADPTRVKSMVAQLTDRYRATGKRIAEMDEAIRKTRGNMTAWEKREEEKQMRQLALQASLREADAALGENVSLIHAREVEIARLETKAEDIARAAGEELREDIRQVLARGTPRLAPDAVTKATEEIQKLAYALSLIGGIDEAVMQEHAETLERHDGLALQLTDLSSALKDLESLVQELDELMAKKRAESFRKIRKEFARFFSVLFGGGKADLVEVEGVLRQAEEGEEPEEAELGIDVVAHPPGKKIMHIAALSGGERTMTALALLAAILHTNPPPFVVLDEVEAALDEANTVRFGMILQELASVSQCILITHNRATMHIADTLYGVTMGGVGVSHLVSVKLPERETVTRK